MPKKSRAPSMAWERDFFLPILFDVLYCNLVSNFNGLGENHEICTFSSVRRAGSYGEFWDYYPRRIQCCRMYADVRLLMFHVKPEKIMRKLIYVKSGKPVQIGDKHRMCGWAVEVVEIRDIGIETFARGSVRVSHLQGARYEHFTYAENIGAKWVDA